MGHLDYHGRRTGVIFGFFMKLMHLARRLETNRFIFAWDSRQSTRKIIYEDYKKREPSLKMRGTDEVLDYDALHTQMDMLFDDIFRRLGFVNVFRRTGLEADDIIATVVKNGDVHPAYTDEPIEWIIASTDRDLYQLLTDNVCMYNLRLKNIYTETDFTKTYGITPKQWVLAKAMGGCDSDKVAGIKGIADPAKSERSRALQILRGELTSGAFVDTVNSDLGQFIIKRNIGLIKLPLAPNLKVQILPDMLQRARFLEVFDELGFNSFLKPDKWADWERYFELTDEMATPKIGRLGVQGQTV
jgi:DNA polymerase-1